MSTVDEDEGKRQKAVARDQTKARAVILRASRHALMQ